MKRRQFLATLLAPLLGLVPAARTGAGVSSGPFGPSPLRFRDARAVKLMQDAMVIYRLRHGPSAANETWVRNGSTFSRVQ